MPSAFDPTTIWQDGLDTDKADIRDTATGLGRVKAELDQLLDAPDGLIEPITRGAGGIQPDLDDSGKAIKTNGAITIPNGNTGGKFFQCVLKIVADTHDITFNGATLDVSAEGVTANESYSVTVWSSTEIDVVGPAGFFTQQSFS